MFINSGGHHGSVANKICDSITVNIDKDSTIDYTADSNGEVRFIAFNHNTHPYVAANIEGKVTFTSSASTVEAFEFIRSNNPSGTTITVTETAKIYLVMKEVTGNAVFASFTTGGAGANKITLHANAITENGALTLGGAALVSSYQFVTTPIVSLIANDYSANDALVSLTGKTDSYNGGYTYYPFAFRSQNGSTYYYGSLSFVAANAAPGTDVAMLNNGVETGSATLSHSFNLVPAAPGLVLKHYGGHLFRITNASAEAPCVITIRDITIEGASTGVLFYLSGDSNGVFEMTDCNMNGSAGVISLIENAVATITLTKGNYTVKNSPFSAVNYSNITLNATDITFVANGTGDTNTLFYMNNSAVGTFNIKGGSATSKHHTFYTQSSSTAYVTIEDFSIVSDIWCMGSQNGTTWYANLTNVNMHTNGSTVTRLYAVAGSYINIMGGTFTTSKTAASDYPSVLTFGNAIAVNIFDAYVTSPYMSAISGLTSTVNITIYGGTFIYCGTEATYAPIMLPKAGNLTVKGGTFINTSGLGPVFSNIAVSGNLLKLESFNAFNNASNLTLNSSKVEGGAPTAPIGDYGRLTLNTLMMEKGARPAFVDGKLAMTFKSTVSAETMEYFKSMTADGTVKFGMLVIPTETLLATGAEFTHAGLARYSNAFGDKLELNKDYFDVTTVEIIPEDDGCFTIKATFDGVADVNTKYSVVFYANYEAMAEIGRDENDNPIYAQVSTLADGTVVNSASVYRYADYEETKNARSLAEISYAAYNNPNEDKFSAAEKEQLAVWGNVTTKKTLDVFLVAGGSNAVGNTPYTKEYADTLVDYVCANCGDKADHAAFENAAYTCVKELTHGKAMTLTGVYNCICGYTCDVADSTDGRCPGQKMTLENGIYTCACGYTCAEADSTDGMCPEHTCGTEMTLENGIYTCTCGYTCAEADSTDGICPAAPRMTLDGDYICSCGYTCDAADAAGKLCPATTVCGTAKSDFKVVLQSTPTNVFYSGIVSQPAPQVSASTTVYATASKYTAIGTAPTLGFGWTADTFGPEYGMAVELAKHYNDTNGKYAAIMKYAVNDAALVAEDPYYGNFSDELYNNFVQMVKDQIANYEDLGYTVNIVGMYWMQGEADVAYADAYAKALETLIANVRADLEVENLPVVVGEVATVIGADTADRTALLNAQNSVTGVIIDSTSRYIADANGIFLDPQDVTATGERVAALLLKAMDETVVVPTIENVTEYVDGNGNTVGHTSLAESLLKAPDGATITLKNDVTVYNTMDVIGSKNITINGNGHKITMAVDATALALQNATVTLDNVVIEHSGDAPAITLDARAEMTIKANCTISATSTAIDLLSTAAKLTIEGGNFTTTSKTAESAIIRTSGANVTIKGGKFTAADGSSIITIEKFSAHKLIVNVMAGEYVVSNAVAFVNNCPAAILVVDPAVTVNGAAFNSAVDMINAAAQ